MSIPVHSGFLPGPGGSLHFTVFFPPGNVPVNHWVLHVPAFAEEMNKCRPMVARQARRFAAQGAVVLVPDLSGTGDSAGEFESADWDRWREDVRYAHRWCLDRGAGRVVLWGVRLGCLLALDALRELPQDSVSALLMWQPVLAGGPHLNQFLRLRTAAGMMQGEAESVSDLRARLEAGQGVEVAGYTVAPRLAAGINGVSAAGLELPAGTALAVLEVAGEQGKPLLPVTAKHVDSWREQGARCVAQTVQGSPFWMTQEIGFAPELLVAGSEFLEQLPTGQAARFEPVSVPTVRESDAVRSDVGVEGIVFSCAGLHLVGQLHRPSTAGELPAGPRGDIGVLIVVGGPQYRVGSHRQFEQLARALSGAGLPVLRFDYRGMGDSDGDLAGFTGVQEDIRSAVDAFQRSCPEISRVVLWGLCDAATAGVSYAHTDARVAGLVLANPWVYSERGEAQAFLRHYYLGRLLSGDFWRKLGRGDFDLRGSVRSLWSFLRSALGGNRNEEEAATQEAGNQAQAGNTDLVAQFASGLAAFDGEVLLITSGNDLTAAEFTDAVRGHRGLRARLDGLRTRQLVLPESDHTFSQRAWSRQVEQGSVDFVLGLRE